MACKVCRTGVVGVCDECRHEMNKPVVAALVAAGAKDGEAFADVIARVTAERDALRAEVEAMRRCVDALRNHGEARNEGEAQDALDALDALRARKVGG